MESYFPQYLIFRAVNDAFRSAKLNIYIHKMTSLDSRNDFVRPTQIMAAIDPQHGVFRLDSQNDHFITFTK